MSTLIIRKKSLKTWLHTDSVLGNFIISKFYFSADDNSFQIVEQGQSKRIIYNVADITLYDEPNGGGAETFTTITALSLRLEQLNYPAFQYDGQITSIANLIAEGTNITIIGDGTEASPYVISATGGGFGTPKLSEVLAEENITDGNDIVISDGDAIELENLSKLQQGTIDNGFGGGISQICTAEKEQQWENGVRYLRAVGGTNVFAETLDDIIPDNSYDNTKNWAVDSYFKNLVTQKLYKCTDATTDSAVWEEQVSGSQTLEQVLTTGNDANGLEIILSDISGDIQKISATSGDIVIASDAYRLHVTANAGLKSDNGVETNNLRIVNNTDDTKYININKNDVDSTYDQTLQNKNGVFAYTDDIPTNDANFRKSILKDNSFWVSPNSTLAGNSLAYSPIVTGNFALQGNTTGNSGMTLFATTASAGTLAFKRRHDAFVFQTLEIEFTQKIRFQTNISGQRFFHGLTKGNQFSAPTNVEPSTLTDIVGVCQLSSSTNMHVIHNDASGTATTIDLGSDYPCNTNTYNYFITIQQTTTSYIVTVERVTVATGASISETRTLTTNIMNYATGVIQVCTWITNNATASIASYLDGGLYGTFKN
jgi:hypothetical protein